MKAQKADVQRYVIEVRFLVDDFSFHAQTPPPHYAFCLRNTHTCSAYSRMQGLALSRMRGRGVECNAVNTQPILPYKHYRCSYLHKRSGAETFSVRLNNHTIIWNVANYKKPFAQASGNSLSQFIFFLLEKLVPLMEFNYICQWKKWNISFSPRWLWKPPSTTTKRYPNRPHLLYKKSTIRYTIGRVNENNWIDAKRHLRATLKESFLCLIREFLEYASNLTKYTLLTIGFTLWLKELQH